MILLHDMINRRVVIIVDVLLYRLTILCTNTNTMTRIEGGNVGRMVLFNNIFRFYILRLPTVV